VIVRRFVFDPKSNAVVEVGLVRDTVAPLAAYEDSLGSWKHRPDEGTGAALRNAALERADRRVHAHKTRGDEKRWSET
jgi:hypothetical protein